MNNERQFLVQRIIDADTETEDRFSSIMTADELIHYIDYQDILDESYQIYEVTEFGKIVPIFYAGWQPDCLIEFVLADGTVILRGWGEDH